MIDLNSDFGARAARHLREETVVWFTTVTPKGAPLPSPVWFLCDGKESVLMYSMPSARIANLKSNPRVTLNFGGDGHGGDIVVFSGTATVDQELPRADANDPYLSKYSEGITRLGSAPEAFAKRYSEPVRIRLSGLRGH
ncbi:MAG: TIGR03667 family PPOX class F420-dependent oxidoreductase [Actinomycetota bacterium]|nr:TIGR03667 family PPOX class F420-dependent oxidoreductase [Actinomycetota bacterium]